MTKQKIYFFIFAACVAGMIWIAINFNKPVTIANRAIQACWFKSITHLPCPSCGSTRSAILFFHGEIVEAILLNPIGILLSILMLIFPVWILFDWLKRSESFFKFYIFFELSFRRKAVFMPFAALILLNWIWNIYKHL
jgi:hypothetical protein